MYVTFREYITEAFKDIGKLSTSELRKGQRLDVGDSGNFTLVDGRTFKTAISRIRDNDIAKMVRGEKYRGLSTLSIYGTSAYKSMKCYLGANNSSGYAIKSGELVSVFSTGGSSAKAILKDAIYNGAKTLDCYAEMDTNSNRISGMLYGLYSSVGFKVDTSKNAGGEYPVHNGVSMVYDNDGEVVHIEDNPTLVSVVVYMKL